MYYLLTKPTKGVPADKYYLRASKETLYGDQDGQEIPASFVDDNAESFIAVLGVNEYHNLLNTSST